MKNGSMPISSNLIWIKFKGFNFLNKSTGEGKTAMLLGITSDDSLKWTHQIKEVNSKFS